jgi:tetratricopeptide (TPR) repeat protein
MYCIKCGKQIEDKSVFCEFCGAAVAGGAIVQQTPPAGNPSQQRTGQKANNLPKFSKKQIAIAGCILGILVAVFIFISISNYMDSPERKVKVETKAAEAGDAEAQYLLGERYFYGNGVIQNYEQAVSWYRKAAEHGHGWAQYKLGLCYRLGNGVTKDDAQGVSWYLKAAEQNIAKAQLNLGFCYSDGSGVTKDLTTALSWYERAAKNEDESLTTEEMSQVQDGISFIQQEVKRMEEAAARAEKARRDEEADDLSNVSGSAEVNKVLEEYEKVMKDFIEYLEENETKLKYAMLGNYAQISDEFNKQQNTWYEKTRELDEKLQKLRYEGKVTAQQEAWLVKMGIKYMYRMQKIDI